MSPGLFSYQFPLPLTPWERPSGTAYCCRPLSAPLPGALPLERRQILILRLFAAGSENEADGVRIRTAIPSPGGRERLVHPDDLLPFPV